MLHFTRALNEDYEKNTIFSSSIRNANVRIVCNKLDEEKICLT